MFLLAFSLHQNGGTRMARKKAKMSATKQAYLKEEKRIKAWKSRAEKRGYTVPETVIPTRPKRFTKTSVQRLKELTPQKLYGMSTYTVHGSYADTTIKGTTARALERKAASRKAQQTRRENIESFRRTFFADGSTKVYRDRIKTGDGRAFVWEHEYEKDSANDLSSFEYELHNEPEEPELKYPTSVYEQEWKPKVDEVWTEERRKQDEKDRERAKKSQDDWLSEGQIVYKKMNENIDAAVGRDSRAANHLKNVLESEISQYGFEPVMKSIAMQSEDIMALAEVALNYRRDTDRHEQAVIEIVNIIRGTIPTAEELQQLSELAEQGEDYDIHY